MAMPASRFSACQSFPRVHDSACQGFPRLHESFPTAAPMNSAICHPRSIDAFPLSVVIKKRLGATVTGFSPRRSRFLLSISAVSATQSLTPAVTLSDKALSHLRKLREQQNKDLCLRIGVRQGGCSGMSYVMDFEERTNIRTDDSIIDFEGFTMVCDPKSLLYLYGMQLDYSDALIGGGFSFKNPNATSTCGCGKSFAA